MVGWADGGMVMNKKGWWVDEDGGKQERILVFLWG